MADSAPDAALRASILPLDVVRARLATVWLAGGGLIFVLLVVQSLMGRYADKTQEAWGWLLPTIMPTLAMIVTVLGYTALDPVSSTFVVRKVFFQVAFWLSTLYLILVLLTILIQPIAANDPAKAVEVMRLSNLWLGPFQGIVASALGVLFVSKQKTLSSESAERQ
jgi:uncharacterized membrane protein